MALRRPRSAELITHLAFYGGWPVAMSGALVAKDVLEHHKK